MNKNPFVPPPSYPSHQQPPLPPGPPPPPAPAGQPDYSSYWAAQQQAVAQPAYNPQWSAPNPQWPPAQPGQVSAPPKPAADQSAALYANYGYGGHQAQWHQQPHYAQPQTNLPPTAPPQPYNPYQNQSTATYAQPPQPYIQQPQPPAQQPFRAMQPQAPHQPFFHQQQQQQQQSRVPANSIQHSPSQQQMPPAKRPRFDNAHQSIPQQPRFQPGSQPMSMQGVPSGPSKQSGLPSQPSQMQTQGNFSGRGGMGGGRGGGMNRGGRGGNLGTSRGMGMNRGRGGGMHGNGGRGGGPNQSSGGSMRGHQSRDRGGFNNNFNRRQGGSFKDGPHHHSGASSRSLRAGGGSAHGNHGRRDGFHQHRGMSSSMAAGSGSGIGKREENRRTLTDFKIVGLEIRSLDWHWGFIPSQSDTEATKNEEDVKKERSAEDTLVEETQAAAKGSSKPVDKEHQAALSASNGATAARMRIYFHTPPSADDARPIISTPSVSDLRKGKRKKADDDDAEDGIRPPPPPPVPNGNGVASSRANDAENTAASVDHDAALERASVAPSVTETASEADWLMAAITDGDPDGDGEMEVYEQTQVESDIGAHENDGELQIVVKNDKKWTICRDRRQFVRQRPYKLTSVLSHFLFQGDFGIDGSVAESNAGQDNTEAQVDGTTRGEDRRETSTAVDASASPEILADKASIQAAKKEEAETADLLSGGESELTISRSERELEVEETSAVKEEHIELIVSSIEPSSIISQNGHEKLEKAHDASVKVENDTSDKPAAADAEHLPEPPASPTSNTAFSGSSTSTSTANPDLPAKPTASSTRAASANRVSIAYATGSRRLIIDAEVVEKMIVFRAEGRIDIDMTVERAEGGFKGILIETLNEQKSYSAIVELSEVLKSDSTLPPFWKAESGGKALISVYLDKERPLSEPKWVKTGDVQDWLKDMFGGRFWVAGEAVGWEKKIEVRYPDPAPTIQTVLTGWAANSPVGIPAERSRFVKTHMTDANNVLEILLRLVRGERATAFAQNSSAISTPSLQGPLLAALDTSSPHAGQQTHVSLAVMAIVRLATQYAEQALGEEKGREQVEERVGEIIRSLPSHLLYKSLDGMFKEWRAEKKGGR